MKKNILFVFIALLFMTGCHKKKHMQPTPSMKVLVAEPVVKDIAITREYPGYIQSVNVVNLVARVSGYLQQISYHPGEYVKKGQTLFVIEPTTYMEDVNQMSAMIEETKQNLVYLQSNYQMTEIALKDNAVSEIQLIQAKSNYNQALATLKNYQAQLRNAQTNLSYCYVKAPVSGRVSVNNYDIGNFLSTSDSSPLATVYEDSKVYAYFNVSENKYLNDLIIDKKSTEVMSSFIVKNPNSLSGETFTATLDYLSPNVEMSTGTVNLRGIIDNTQGKLRDGMYVKVTLPYMIEHNAFIVRDASIGTNQLGDFMYVVNDSNKVETRQVVTGEMVQDSLRHVLSGLKMNDRYVVNALLKVRDGMIVDPYTSQEK